MRQARLAGAQFQRARNMRLPATITSTRAGRYPDATASTMCRPAATRKGADNGVVPASMPSISMVAGTLVEKSRNPIRFSCSSFQRAPAPPAQA